MRLAGMMVQKTSLLRRLSGMDRCGGKSATLTLAVRGRSIFAERRRYQILITVRGDNPLAQHERRFVH
jgi:hypothetical protein